MGTKDLTFVQLNQLIGRKTGGISLYPFTSSVRGREDPCSHIVARGKAMAGRVEDLFNLVSVVELFCYYNRLKWLSSSCHCRYCSCLFSPEGFSTLGEI